MSDVVNRQEILLASANASAQLVGTEDFAQLVRATLGFTSTELIQHLDERDQPGLFAPIELARDGKSRQGALLALNGRAVIVWVVGVIKMKPSAVVLPAASIEKFEKGVKSGTFSGNREVLTIFSQGQMWAMTFVDVFTGGRSIVPFIEPALRGGLTPQFAEG